MHTSFEKAVAEIANAYCSWFHMNYERAVYQFKKAFSKNPCCNMEFKVIVITSHGNFL